MAEEQGKAAGAGEEQVDALRVRVLLKVSPDQVTDLLIEAALVLAGLNLAGHQQRPPIREGDAR